MNDTQRELVGKNSWELTDPNGIKVIQQERKIADNPNGDFLYYSWNKPSIKKTVPKISFIKGVKDWQWMVGTGIYLDDTTEHITRLQRMVHDQIRTSILLSISHGIIITIIFLL